MTQSGPSTSSLLILILNKSKHLLTIETLLGIDVMLQDYQVTPTTMTFGGPEAERLHGACSLTQNG